MTALSLARFGSSTRTSALRPVLSIRDVVAALVVSGWGVFMLVSDTGSWPAAGGMLLVGLPILLRRRRPLVALALLVAIGIWLNGLLFGVNIRCSAELPAVSYLVFEAVRAAQVRRDRVLIGFCCVAFLAGVNASDPIMSFGGGLKDATLLVLAMAGSGEIVRRRDLEVRQLERDIPALEAQRDDTVRVATEAERLRIGVDLVAAVESRLAAILSGVSSTEAALDRGEATSGFLAIEETGRDTLMTMRASLGVLRGTGPVQTGVGTLPGLADLKGLLDSSGRPATVRLEGNARPLGAASELTAYRILEHLLMAVDSERGPVEVVLHYGATELELHLCGQAATGTPTTSAASIQAARVRAGSVGGMVRCNIVHGALSASSRLPLEPAFG